MTTNQLFVRQSILTFPLVRHNESREKVIFIVVGLDGFAAISAFRDAANASMNFRRLVYARSMSFNLDQNEISIVDAVGGIRTPLFLIYRPSAVRQVGQWRPQIQPAKHRQMPFLLRSSLRRSRFPSPCYAATGWVDRTRSEQ